MTIPIQLSSFEKLISRHRLRARLVAVSALRIGAGKSFDMAATDLPVVRDALGRPYIPGSSLKGVLRAGLERVLRGLDLEKPPCDPFLEPCIPNQRDQRAQRDRDELSIEDLNKRLCPVCGLFGSPQIGGRVFLRDLPLLGTEHHVTEVRDGVGIDRDLGTASIKTGTKFDVEAVAPGTAFELEMLIENADPWQLALLLKALELLDQGEIRLGGLTTRGMGRVRLEEPELARTDAARLLAGRDFETLSYADEQQAAGDRLMQALGGER